MVDTVSAAGLGNLEEINDIVQRKKYSDRRLRNEAIRTGLADVNSFATENQPQLQQAEQPSEFLGATRKEISNPNYDSSAANLVGGIQNTSYGKFYYGDVDPSTAQWGTNGYTTKDLGGGVYDIFNSDGTSLGHGYYDPIKAANQLFQQNALKQKNSLQPTKAWFGVSELPTTQNTTQFTFPRSLDTSTTLPDGYRLNPNYDPQYFLGGSKFFNDNIDRSNPYQQLLDGYSWGGKDYKTLQEAQAAIDAATGSWGGGNQAGGLADWEILGQALNGALSPAGLQQWGGLPVNNQSENISGLNTLFGSTPLIVGGKLVGYKMNLGAGDSSGSWSNGGPDKVQWNPFGYQSTHSGQSHSWNTSLGRTLNDQATWAKLGSLIDKDKNTFFVSQDNASKLPGWTNQESYAHQDNNWGWGGGLLSGIFGTLDPILDKIDPLHNKVQTWTTGSSTTEGQLPYFKSIMPMILNGFFPGVGSAVTAVDNASTGNYTGAVANAAGSYLGMSGGIDTGYGNYANTAANGAAGSAINAAGKGGDFEDMLKAAVIGALSGGAGQGVADATSSLGSTMSSLLSGATKGAVSSLANPKQMLESAIMSGAAGGLSGMFNANTTDKQEIQRNNQMAQNAVKLAKIFAKR